MTLMNYLDLYDLFVNEISGSAIIFIFFSLLLILFMCAKARMPNIITLGIMVVYMLLISPFFQGVLAITLFIIGIFFAWALSRIITRG